ncbi:hypothetical protein FCG67_05905 [Rhodococcus oryzae]|jgi:hypothetical protein|uniref:Secreted protein n=1 Tax=Rhodococcus oryzae TaxID=2571143 RepID=A0ABY2RPH2_9NOCA|nr:hypothetical protein [Rhodococcus oryzae]TJZ80381.1 hypothetical protein FCG67_05905 [Rhodococcus oryzae]
MQAATRSGLKRLAGGAAIAVATVATVTMTMPATASAASILPPEVNASSSGNSITMSIKNPNPILSLTGCQAFVVNAADVPAVVENPVKLLDPGVVVYPNVANPLTLFGALPGMTVNSTTNEIPTGVYGVIGGCVSLLDLMNPVIDSPKIMQVGLLPGGSSDGSSALPFGS